MVSQRKRSRPRRACEAVKNKKRSTSKYYREKAKGRIIIAGKGKNTPTGKYYFLNLKTQKGMNRAVWERRAHMTSIDGNCKEQLKESNDGSIVSILRSRRSKQQYKDNGLKGYQING